jgi:hypothetical protein
MVKAHTTTQHLTLVEVFPDHSARTEDPHYHVFNETRRRLKRLGKLKCWIDNADCSPGPIELHHSLVEYSLANIVDVEHFRELYPEFGVEDDDSFLDWVNSEGNLLPLCVQHHRGVLGIHSVHYSGWIVQRVMKDGITPPERKV